MIRINQEKIKVNHTEQELLKKVCTTINRAASEIAQYHIVKQSIDARKKPDLYFSYVIDVCLKNTKKEETLVSSSKNNTISLVKEISYQFPEPGVTPMNHRPIIIGMGPAGLFCGYYLAKHGYRPIILERGKDVEQRTKDVESFWKTGKLERNSNVQFGEGGAGTFSDGKLNTLVKDKSGRNKEVLKTLVQFGAPETILYDAKPHIGTDLLINIVKSMREEILALGGEIHFESQVVDFRIEHNKIKAVKTVQDSIFNTEDVILAIGHSARDTFELLYHKETSMEAKTFAVGFRVEQPQILINQSQYGTKKHEILGAAPDKLATKASNGRGVYSFCM